MAGLDLPRNPDVLVGLSTGDDAGVFRISPDRALVQTVDFITPVVDDPFVFGQIAAANSLSDVWAMGGAPLTAMNVLLYPSCELASEDAAAVIAGAADKIREAGAALVGGHTVENPELVFGLSVTGLVHPDRLVANSLARPGDQLLLTKPLGLGVLSTAVKAGLAPPELQGEMARCMATLNRVAAECMLRHGVRAATDVTGFGLAGHALAVAKQSGVDLAVDWASVPLLDGAADALREGLAPQGAYANRQAFAPDIDHAGNAEALLLACDPQTSGGLLICAPEQNAAALLADLHSSGVAWAARIGEVRAGTGRLALR